MTVLVAIVMGLLSGLLLHLMTGMLYTDLSGKSEPRVGLWFVVFFVGWALSAVALARGARTVSWVVRRGFLLAAAECMIMASVGTVFSGKAISSASEAAGNQRHSRTCRCRCRPWNRRDDCRRLFPIHAGRMPHRLCDRLLYQPRDERHVRYGHKEVP